MLRAVQELLVRAVLQDDPARWLAAQLAAGAGGDLDADERAALLAVDAEGLHLVRLLVDKLRFERLLRGDPAARAAFERDPVALVDRYRSYVASVPPSAVFPAEEAAAFAAFEAAARAAPRSSASE